MGEHVTRLERGVKVGGRDKGDAVMERWTNSSIDALAELKQSILHKAFMGELSAQPNHLELDLP